MRERFPCGDCGALVRYAELADGRHVVLDATPTSGVRERYALAAPGRVVRTDAPIAFALHRCPAQRAPAADAPRRAGH